MFATPLHQSQSQGLSAMSGMATPTPASKKDIDVNTLDVDAMMDITSYVGVDLEEEEDSLSNMLPPTSTRTLKKQDPFLNLALLETRLNGAAKSLDMKRVDSDVSQLISIATEAFMRDFMTSLKEVTQHREQADIEYLETDPDLEIVPTDDPAEILDDLQSREEAQEKEWISKYGIIKNAPVLRDPISKKKKQSEKQIALHMPEAVKNKMINTTAMMAAGGTIKSWMMQGSNMRGVPSRLLPKDVSVDSPKESFLVSRNPTKTGRVLLTDALTVLESHQTFRHGPVLYKWLANIK